MLLPQTDKFIYIFYISLQPLRAIWLSMDDFTDLPQDAHHRSEIF